MQINSITDTIPNDIIPSSILYVLCRAHITTFADLIRYNVKDIVYLPNVGNSKALQFQEFKDWILKTTNYLELEKIEIERLSKERLDSFLSNWDFINLISYDVPSSLFSEEIKKDIFKNQFICSWNEVAKIESTILPSNKKLNYLENHLNNCINLLSNFTEINISEMSLSVLKEKKLNDLPVSFLDKDEQLEEHFIEFGIYDLEDFINFLNNEENKDIKVDFLPIKKRLNKLIKVGLSEFLFGDSRIRTDLDSFLNFIIENEKDPNIDFNLINSRNYMSLEELGQRYGITRERVRQKIKKYFLTIFTKYKFAVNKINEIIFNRVKKHGGIISSEQVWNSDSVCSFDTIRFFCSGYFNSKCKVLGKRLVILNDSNIEIDLTAKFKGIFKEIESINLDEIMLDTEKFGWKSTKITLKVFLQDIMNLNIDENGNIDTSEFASGVDIVENILKNSPKPLHFSEVAEIIKNTNWFKSYDNLTNFERAIHATIDRAENAILFGPGTFIHKDNLEIEHPLLDKIIKICKDELKNFEYPTSTEFLCKLLKNKYDIESNGINSYSLNSLLNKEPEIDNYRKNRVGFKGIVKYDKSISEILEDILLQTENPLTLQEVPKLFPKNFSVPLTSLPNAINSSKNIVLIRENILKITHINSIKEFLYLKEKIKDLALIYLKNFSEKIYVKELINYIRKNLDLSEEKNCETAIRVFLQKSSELYISSNGIVFLREFLNNKDKSDLIDLISLIIDSEIVIKPAEIRDILKNDYKFYDLVDPTFYAAIERGRSKNLYIKKPYSLYYSSNIDESTLYQKIKVKYSSTIENALNKLTEQQVESDFETVSFLCEYLFYNEKYTKCLFLIDNFILNYSNQDISKFKEIKDTCLLSI